MKVKISSEALLQGKQQKDVNDLLSSQQEAYERALQNYNTRADVLESNSALGPSGSSLLTGLTQPFRGLAGQAGQLGGYLLSGQYDRPIEDFANTLPVSKEEELAQMRANPFGYGAGNAAQILSYAINVGGAPAAAAAKGTGAAALYSAGSNLSAGKNMWEDLIPNAIIGGAAAGVLSKGGELINKARLNRAFETPAMASKLSSSLDDLAKPVAQSAGSKAAVPKPGQQFKAYTSMTETPVLSADDIAKYASASPDTPIPTGGKSTGQMIPLAPSGQTGFGAGDVIDLATTAPTQAAAQVAKQPNILQKIGSNLSDTFKRVGKETGDYAFIRESGGGKPQSGIRMFRDFEKAFPGFTTMKNSVNDAVALINKTIREDVPVITNALKAADDAGIKITRDEILSKVMARKNTKVLSSLKGQYGSAIDDIITTLGDADSFTVKDINKIRANVGEAMGSNWDLMNKGALPRPVYQAYRDIYVSLRNLIDRKIIEAGGPSLKAVNNRVHMATEMQDFLVRNNTSYMPKSGFTGIDAIIAGTLTSGGRPIEGLGAVAVKRGLQSPPAVRKVAQAFTGAGDVVGGAGNMGSKIKSAVTKPLKFMKDGTLKLEGALKKQADALKPVLRVAKTGSIIHGQKILTKAGEEWTRQQSAALPIQEDVREETYDNQQSMGLQFLQQKQSTWKQRMVQYISMGFTAQEAVKQIQDEDQQEFENLLALEKQSGGSIKTAAAKDISSAKSGLRAVNTLKTILENDPTVRWQRDTLGGGALSFLQSPNAKQFSRAATEATDVLARLRTGAVINDEEAARYETYIPNMWDDAETIEYKLGVLQDLFNSIAGI